MPADKIGGGRAHVRDAALYTPTQPLALSASKLSSALHSFLGSSPSSSSSIPSLPTLSPPPAYHDVYPPSPPSTAPSSPQTLAVSDASSISSKCSSRITNKWQTSLTSPPAPVKPLLTPRSSEDRVSTEAAQQVDSNVIFTLFPSSSPIHDLPSTAADLSDVVPTWRGAVLDNQATGLRTLYVMSTTSSMAKDVNMRDAICGVLEKAEEEFGATGVVMALDKSAADLGELVHQLCYVGGTITNQPFASDPRYVLVALDLM